jgi:sugar phosphate isomerase/epimerase
MRRREFLFGSTFAVARVPSLWGQRPNQDKLDRIAIMSLCFSTILKTDAHPNDPKRTLDILDLPDMYAERYGVHHVELQHSHFRSTEPHYLEEFRRRLNKAKSRMNQINLEFGPLNISSADPVLLLETIDLSKRWIDHAAMVGCQRVMVNQGTLALDVRQSAIATLQTINAYAKVKKVFVTMENRGGGQARTATGTGATTGGASNGSEVVVSRPTSPNWDTVVEVIQAAGIWANPDVGNFPNEASRAAGLRAMYPLSSGSSHCHYDPERYSEATAIRISKEVGYKGLFSIEATANNGPDPYAAVQTILDELIRDI